MTKKGFKEDAKFRDGILKSAAARWHRCRDVSRGPDETWSKLQVRSCSSRDARCKAGGRAFRRSVSSGLRVLVRKTGLELDSRDRGRTVFLDETHDK